MRVQLCTGHFLISDDNGHEVWLSFDKLSPGEETELRQIALAQLPKRTAKPKRAKRSRGRVGRASKRTNYAELVCKRDAAGVNENKL